MDFFNTQEGRVVNNDGQYEYQYFLKDHLGNVRAAIACDVTSGGLVHKQVNQYYPFGLELADIGMTADNDNKFKYNAKELEDDHNLYWYHYGARYYDPQLGRWHVTDPADEYNSPYIYVGNAPTIAVDPDGSKTDWLTVGNGRGTSYFGHTGTPSVKHNPNEPWWLSAPVWVLAGQMTFVGGGLFWGAAGLSVKTYSGLYFTNTITGSFSNTLFNDYKNPDMYMRDVMIGGFKGGLSSSITSGISIYTGALPAVPINSIVENFVSNNFSGFDSDKTVTNIWSSLLLKSIIGTSVGANILTEALYNSDKNNYGSYNNDGLFYTTPVDETRPR